MRLKKRYDKVDMLSAKIERAPSKSKIAHRDHLTILRNIQIVFIAVRNTPDSHAQHDRRERNGG